LTGACIYLLVLTDAMRTSHVAQSRSKWRNKLNGTHHVAAHNKKSTVRPDPRLAHDQSQSKFFSLPPEIRDQIYRELFSLLEMCYYYKTPITNELPDQWLGDTRPEILRIPPLLQVCRSINRELGTTWTRSVKFRFTDSMILLDILTPQPQHKLLRIRRLEVDAEKLPLLTSDGCIHFNVNACLKFLGGLRLDSLVIWDRSRKDLHKAFQMYHLIDDLVKSGTGWKELRVMGGNYCLGLCLRRSAKSVRKPQPSHWRAVLNERGDVGGSVEILQRKTGEDAYTPVDAEIARMWSDTWELELTKLVSGELNEVWLKALSRFTMVVVRRGRNADISNGGSVILENPKQDIRRWFPGESWEEIRPAIRAPA
jgi:hypothetical protein